MEKRHLLGRIGEQLALEFLQKRGYRLLARNWRDGHKELDLVMEDDCCLRIIEVRCRSLSRSRSMGRSMDMSMGRSMDGRMNREISSTLSACDWIPEPSLTVNRVKQKRLISAANGFAKRHRIGKEIVFDIVSIVADGSQFHIEYLPNAFSPAF